MAGLVIAVLAGLVGYLTLARAAAARAEAPATAGPEVQVVVASQAVQVRAVLTDKDVSVRKLSVNAAPEGALRETRFAVGKVTMVDLYPGEVILQQRLADPNVKSADGRTALMMAGDEVLMAFPAEDLMSKVGVLKPGDHVDLLFSLKVPSNRGLAAAGRTTTGGGSTNEEQATFNLLPNVTISALVADPAPAGRAGGAVAPQAILLTVSQQDALTLKYVKDAGGVLDMVLRAPGSEQPVTTEPVDVDYLIRRYQIPTEVGR
jgi:pilus assembly protein CpaB